MGLTLNNNSLNVASSGGGAASGVSTSDVTTLIKNNTPYQYIETLTASNSTSLDFTNIGTYTHYKIIIDSLMPSSSVYFYMRVYLNGSEDSSAKYYFNYRYGSWGSESWTYDVSSYFSIAAAQSFNKTVSGEVDFSNGDETKQPSMAFHLGSAYNSGSLRWTGGASYWDNITVDGFKFYPSSSNWASGKIHLYGVNR